jgi:hypothetical protein
MQEISERIKKIKNELQALGDLRPGSLTKQYGKPKEKKGVFFQINYTHKMKSKSDYVKKDFVEEMEIQLKEYKKMKALVDEWIELGIKKSKLLMKTKSNR